MCTPIDPLLVEKKGSVLLNKLVIELHSVYGAFISEPRFVDSACGNRLCDMELNSNHAIEHMHSALHIISLLHEEGYINEEGG